MHLRPKCLRDGLSGPDASDLSRFSSARGKALRTNQMFDEIKPYLIERFMIGVQRTCGQNVERWQSWSNASDSKSDILVRVSGVRIPLSPPFIKNNPLRVFFYK